MVALKGLMKDEKKFRFEKNLWNNVEKTSDRSNSIGKVKPGLLARSWPMFGGSNTKRGTISLFVIGP